ncbi:unnamed protein product [Closterium sp. Yama58-4]|nr:unnamed protein product [Closterium sp. Yama58-4]
MFPSNASPIPLVPVTPHFPFPLSLHVSPSPSPSAFPLVLSLPLSPSPSPSPFPLFSDLPHVPFQCQPNSPCPCHSPFPLSPVTPCFPFPQSKVYGVITDGGTSFKTVVASMGLKHQQDVWHMARTLIKALLRELVDARKDENMKVEAARTIEDLWHIKKSALFGWLEKTGCKGDLTVSSIKEALIRAVCSGLGTIAFKTIDPSEASYKHPELRQVVVRLAGIGTGTNHLAEAIRALDDAPTVPSEGETTADSNAVVFEDVAQMFAWDPHPVYGARPSSYASLLLAQEVAGRSDTVAATTETGAEMTEQEGTVKAREGERRWVRKAKRSRRAKATETGGTDRGIDPPEGMAAVEEVSVAQRYSIHFHHVMTRCATLAKEGRPMSPGDVADELALSAEHWAGDHSRCARHGIIPRCVADSWGPESAVYEHGGTTHLAFREWLSKHCSAGKMQPFVLGASSWVNESFHSVICKYAPKRIHFRGSMEARIALSILHWNNTVERLVRRHIVRLRRATRVRRGKKGRVLGPMNWQWTKDIFNEWRLSSSITP